MAGSKTQNIFGVLTSADVSTGTEASWRFTLYDMQSQSTVSVSSDQWVVVKDCCPGYGGAVTAKLFSGGDTAVGSSELICEFQSLVGGPAPQVFFPDGHWCVQGTYPKITTNSSAQIDATLRGFIYTQPTS